MLLKIKVTVVHAGLLDPQLPPKVITQLNQAILFPYLSNKFSTVQMDMVVMVAISRMPLVMSKTMVRFLSLITAIKQNRDLAEQVNTNPRYRFRDIIGLRVILQVPSLPQ